MAVWLPKRTVNGMKQVVKHRSDRYSSSLHLVSEESGTRFSDVRTPQAKGAIMPATQTDHEKNRAYIAQVRGLRRAAARREESGTRFSDVRTPQAKGAIMPATQTDHEKNRAYIAQVRGLRRAAARRRRWLAGGLLAAAVVVLVLAIALHFSPFYALIPAALCAVVCALGVRASKQARAWEAKMAAKERDRKRKTAAVAKRAAKQRAQQAAAQVAAAAPHEEDARTDVLEQREIRRALHTDVLEQREIRRALHQGRIEQQEALARRQAEQAALAAQSKAQPAQPAAAKSAEQPAVVSENHRMHAQLVVRDHDTAYPLDETNELSRVSPASAVDAFDMAVNQDLISFSLGSPRNGVEIEQDDALSLEIKSTRQVAKATPRAVEPDAEVEIEQDDALSLEIKSTRQVAKATPRAVEPDAEPAPAASDAAEPAEESGQTDAKAAQPNRAAVNDSVAFHETEASAAVEAPGDRGLGRGGGAGRDVRFARVESGDDPGAPQRVTCRNTSKPAGDGWFFCCHCWVFSQSVSTQVGRVLKTALG